MEHDADIRASLPVLLPLAISWAEEQSRIIQLHGFPLPEEYVHAAQSVGVGRPELVRVASVRAIPQPEHPQLRAAALHVGLLGPHMTGLTLGYGIVVVVGQLTPSLMSHELRHVHQYEAAGSIAAYLPV